MDSTTELLSHIHNEADRRTLRELIRRHDVLRIRLASKVGIDLREKLQVAEARRNDTSRALRKVLVENDELRARVKSLETKLERLLREWRPPQHTRLHQPAIRRK